MNIDDDDLDLGTGSDANLIPVLRRPQLQESYGDKWILPPGAMLNSFPNEDINFEDGFTFTGLLQGNFDTFYRPYLAKKQVRLSGDAGSSKTYSEEMCMASSSKASSSKKVLFAEHGIISRSNSEICENARAVAAITDGENHGCRTSYGKSDDDPWGQNLFEDVDFDEQISPDVDSGEHQVLEERDDEAMDSGCPNCSQDERVHGQSDGEKSDGKEQLCEKDIDDFLEKEKEGDNGAAADIENSLKPEVGMVFKSRENAQNCFNLYALAIGFSVVIVGAYRTTSKKRNNEITRVTVKCNKFGKNTEREREEQLGQRASTVIVKTDCKVEMIVSERGGLWTIKTLNLKHNHVLDPHSRYFRSHAFMTDEEKALIRSLKHSNIPTVTS